MTIMTRLSFVKKEFETNDIYTFYFAAKKQPRHRAGQHGLFILPGIYIPHPFSLSNAPEEKYITITTHTATDSRYKKKLLALQPGDTMLLMGPILNFTFKKNESSYVFLAQGIGITPFRSMLVHAQMKKLPLTTTLIHVDKKGHAFKEETKRSATQAYYPASSEAFRQLIKKQSLNQTFYISGSSRFIASTKRLLRQEGVQPNHIKTDLFLGY